MIRVVLGPMLKRRGLSQRALAKNIGTHPNVVSRLVRGETTAISFDLLDGICRELACTPGDVLTYLPPERNDQIPLFPG